MKAKIKPPLSDLLGRDLDAGNPVAFFHRGKSMMMTGRIKKLSKVNVTVEFATKWGEGRRSIRASEVILLAEQDYIFHKLRNSN